MSIGRFRVWFPIVATGVVFAAAVYEATPVPAPPANQIGWEVAWGAPPPPLYSYLVLFLTAPGFLISLPSVILTEFLGLASSWKLVAHVPGIAVSWYCIGHVIDEGRCEINQQLPTILRRYLSLMRVISIPAGLLMAYGISEYSPWCMSGTPPVWSTLLQYGVLLLWATVGTYFALRSWREKRKSATASKLTSAT